MCKHLHLHASFGCSVNVYTREALVLSPSNLVALSIFIQEKRLYFLPRIWLLCQYLYKRSACTFSLEFGCSVNIYTREALVLSPSNLVALSIFIQEKRLYFLPRIWLLCQYLYKRSACTFLPRIWLLCQYLYKRSACTFSLEFQLLGASPSWFSCLFNEEQTAKIG